MKIVFATNNQHKLDEIRSILGDKFEVVSLAEIGCHEDIPETGQTLEENALMKAQYVYDHYHVSCFADDTGLEVDALNGAPGVFSARYAGGVGHDSQANMDKLLRELESQDNRKARFRTVIALIEKKDVCPCGCTSIKQIHRFEGIVEGRITRQKSGVEGFGYDPIFEPDGYDKTFAELGMDIKNHISHRARATQKLAQYLLSLCLLLFACLPLNAQIGTWRNYLAYYDIQQIQEAGNDLFVMASNGLYQYNRDDQSIVTYDKTNGLSDTNIKHIRWNQQAKRLIAVYNNCNMDLIDTKGNVTNISDLYTKPIIGDKTVNSVRIDGVYAYLICGFGIVKVNMQRAEIADSYTPNHPDYPTQLPDEDNTSYDKYINLVKTLKPGGPKHNYNGFLIFKNDKLYTTDGIIDGNFVAQNAGQVQIFDSKNNEWTILQDRLDTITGHAYRDLGAVDVDPLDANHIFAGGSTGLYEFNNGRFVKEYNYDNSPLRTTAVLDTPNKNYTMANALVYDSKGSLWLLNSGSATTSLFEITTDGTWESHHHKEFLNSSKRAYDNMVNAMFDSNGNLWFCNDRFVEPALLFYQPSTDVARSYSSFNNQDGTLTSTVRRVSCVKEDKDGNVWIGTNIGPFMFEKSQWSESNPYFTQVKVPRNDGTNYADYLLANIDINCMAIDGAGRKWFGTTSNGVYLISSDNMTQIQHFTKDSSPLLDDNILAIVINDKSGEVFFGTENGLCSYVSDATETNTEMTEDNVWAYPNPITADYTGYITITGLSYTADVKILASNGAIVNEGRSNGGTYLWDGCDTKGRRVASGVYMVATATQSGEKGTVCKIAIVR